VRLNRKRKCNNRLQVVWGTIAKVSIKASVGWTLCLLEKEEEKKNNSTSGKQKLLEQQPPVVVEEDKKTQDE
jgi:hypothetical protein